MHFQKKYEFKDPKVSDYGGSEEKEIDPIQL